MVIGTWGSIIPNVTPSVLTRSTTLVMGGVRNAVPVSIDYEKEAEARFQAAEEALESILRLEAELDARLADRNLEGSISITSSLMDAIVQVRGILVELKTVKLALGIPSIPPAGVAAVPARTRTTHQSSTRTRIALDHPEQTEEVPAKRKVEE